MAHDDGPPYRGHSDEPGASLKKAVEDAWTKAQNAPAGRYKVQFEIETTNPIHSYVAILSPADDD